MHFEKAFKNSDFFAKKNKQTNKNILYRWILKAKVQGMMGRKNPTVQN